MTLWSELKNKETENLWATSSAMGFFSFTLSKAYRMSYEMIGRIKIEAATGQTLDQARTRLSTSHRPSGRNSRRGTEPNLNNPSSGLLGWLMRCYAAAMTPLSSLLFPITTYTHSGMSVLPKEHCPWYNCLHYTTCHYGCMWVHTYMELGGCYGTFQSEAHCIEATGPIIKPSGCKTWHLTVAG